jgi:transposase
MPYSSSLTDREWEIIEPLLPRKKRTKPPKWSKREILDGVLYQLKNGCNWCDLPQDLPPYSTVFWHYKQWRMERCKSLVKNFERTLDHATTKLNLCFVRLMLKRLART